MAPRAIQGLRGGRDVLRALAADLARASASTQQWAATAESAGASGRELMERLQQTAADLHAVTAQLRASEAERAAADARADAADAAAGEAHAELEELRAAMAGK